ncbi:MAG: NAD(P)/FAD-dependent oxidoreductase [Acidobacteriota bacterium]|nr:NAD(P)/FAD-dependent oxidoreductase [Acidobacteriota bacterium]
MYERLFSPVMIGPVRVKNRVAMTAMGANLGAPGGGVTDDIIAFYEARARGGVGLIISEICRVMDGPGAGEACQLAARDPGDLQGLARLADTIHKYGTKFFVQLHHPGAAYALDDERPVAASEVEALFGTRAPRALGVPEIHQIQQAFATGARIAMLAGADGVELHGAHGYLINSFLSPHLNRRTDEYGGTFDNRLRFVREALAASRAATRPDFPIGIRISAEEFLGEAGIDLATSSRIALELQQAGANFIDVSCYCYTPGSPHLADIIEPGTYPQGWKKYMAAEIKRQVDIPVIAVANVKEPDVAEAMLQEGACDLVGVARGHLADPQWCNKARTGRAELITKCIGCLVCFQEISDGRHVKCSVNPTTGREREYTHLERDGAGRTVAVVGGGPAGITAALLLARRRFRPVLFETAPKLGGTLSVADKGIAKEKITRLVDCLVAQVKNSRIELRLGEQASVQTIGELSPCGVFIACGAEPFVPPIPGITAEHVVSAEDVLLGRVQAKGDCVVVGSGMTGLETAEVLLAAGHKVTIVEMQPQIGAGVQPIVIFDLMNRMARHDPNYLLGHRLVEIVANGVIVETVAEHDRVSVPAETVVLALGVRPRAQIVDTLTAAFPDAHIVGDAVRGARILEATQDAYGQAFVFQPSTSSQERLQ